MWWGLRSGLCPRCVWKGVGGPALWTMPPVCGGMGGVGFVRASSTRGCLDETPESSSIWVGGGHHRLILILIGLPYTRGITHAQQNHTPQKPNPPLALLGAATFRYCYFGTGWLATGSHPPAEV